MPRTSAISLLFVPLLLACSSASDRATPGSKVDVQAGGTGGSVGGSGPSLAGGPSSGGSGNALNVGPEMRPDAGDVMNGECARQDVKLSRQPAEILLLLDRSGSMKEKPSGSTGSDSKWNLVVPAVNEVVTATDASISWGLKAFPEGEGNECTAASVTSDVPVPIAPSNAAAVTGQVMILTPEGNGTPTGDAINAAVSYLKGLTDANPKFILLATDGEPSCGSSSGGSTNARTYAVQAVTDAASAGIKTVVVGVATTKSSATQALNDMANAGKMPQISADPAAPKYYLASTKDELVQALVKITGQVSNCVFDLTTKPPDPSNIAVEVDGQKAPHDTTHSNGWDYLGSDYSQVEVFGTWCEGIKSATANSVNFVLGCPGEVIQ
ncbi:MAG TPA: vWA domain-containing protein [Polyangiaceae bacterium]|nr:vWA domain-containing protein [Polyangiaceae bacterium]